LALKNGGSGHPKSVNFLPDACTIDFNTCAKFQLYINYFRVPAFIFLKLLGYYGLQPLDFNRPVALPSLPVVWQRCKGHPPLLPPCRPDHLNSGCPRTVSSPYPLPLCLFREPICSSLGYLCVQYEDRTEKLT